MPDATPAINLEKLYDLAPVGLCVVDRDLRFLRANASYAKTVRRTPEELIGLHMGEVIPESAIPGATEAARRVVETGEPVLDLELRRDVPDAPEKRLVWLVNIHPLFDGDQISGAIAVLQNVTSIRGAEEAATARLREIEAIYRNAPVGLTFVDRDLRYLRVNQVIADINGVSIDEMLGKTYRDLSPETANEVEPFLMKVMEQGKALRNVEMRTRPPTDLEQEHSYLVSIDPVHGGDGKIIGHVSAVQDITELQRVEEEARRRLRELETIYANAPVGLCYLDADLRIVHLNRLFSQLSDVAETQQIGSLAEEVLGGEVARQLVPELKHSARTGLAAIDIEVHGRVPSLPKRSFTWSAQVHPVKGSDGSLNGIIAVLQDVTERAERQRNVERVRDRLLDAQQIANLGTWEWNLIEDTIWWSRELYEIFGAKRSLPPSIELFFEFVHPEDRPRLREQLDKIVSSGQPARTSFRITRDDGEERVLFAAARMERSPDGEARRIIGTDLDVTELAMILPGNDAFSDGEI